MSAGRPNCEKVRMQARALPRRDDRCSVRGRRTQLGYCGANGPRKRRPPTDRTRAARNRGNRKESAMTGPTFKTQFGRIFPPRQDWLAKALPEPVLEPELPIIDTHHHVWRDRGGYMLDDVMADMSGSGHNTVASVFIDCRFQYRADGPAEMRSIGEVEAVHALALVAQLGGLPPRTRLSATITMARLPATTFAKISRPASTCSPGWASASTRW